MQTSDRPHHTERVKRLSVLVPRDIADEISELPTCAKARLLLQQAEDLLDRIEEYPALWISSTSTQWIESLTTKQQCQLIENLALQIMAEVRP